MSDFKVYYDNRIYSAFVEKTSVINPGTLEAKIIMYGTTYTIIKDQNTGTWNNAESNKLKISKGLLGCLGSQLEEHLQSEHAFV